MRKIAFIQIPDESRKVMIYYSSDGVFLFGYDCIEDTSSKWDNWYLKIEDAENYCQHIYNITHDDWIVIAEPKNSCQVDVITPCSENDRLPESNVYERSQGLTNVRWREKRFDRIYTTFDGLTGNERLFITGLIGEFDEAMQTNKEKARKILTALQFDANAIQTILRP